MQWTPRKRSRGEWLGWGLFDAVIAVGASALITETTPMWAKVGIGAMMAAAMINLLAALLTPDSPARGT